MIGPMLTSPAYVPTSPVGAGDGRFDPLTLLRIIQDTAVRPAPHELLDSVVVDPVLPDPLVPIVQWIFQRPPWVMQAGIVLGAIVALVALFLVWRWRRGIIGYLRGLTKPAKLALAGGIAAVALLAAVGGWQANNYMMHDNNFCRGCHIFVPSGRAFVKPDTGTYLLVNALEGKHDTLTCHSCHPFDVVAQTKELYFWIMDRPEDIPPHGKVPRDVCEQCHVQGDARDTWQRIASTAGHRTHLESDSVLKIVTTARAAGEPGHGEEHATGAAAGVGCLTCHATSAHRFQPADSTCAQQGCHLTSEIDIRLGKMADQAGLHCNVCHQFTAEVPLLATRDSAAGTLTPAREQCLGCHQMRALLAEFDPAADPHAGT
jgi:nitrate/TMAO reductase-like tetraheme cytochrome c subunit